MSFTPVKNTAQKLNPAKSSVDFQRLIGPHPFAGHVVVIINSVKLNILIAGRNMARDIDMVIERVCALHPDATVEQLKVTWPADDDGLWFFRLPGVRKEIQVESSTGAAPFVIEHDGMTGLEERIRDASIDQAVIAVSAYFSALKKGDPAGTDNDRAAPGRV